LLFIEQQLTTKTFQGHQMFKLTILNTFINQMPDIVSVIVRQKWCVTLIVHLLHVLAARP